MKYSLIKTKMGIIVSILIKEQDIYIALGDISLIVGSFAFMSIMISCSAELKNVN